jgi:hypothetical protein
MQKPLLNFLVTVLFAVHYSSLMAAEYVTYQDDDKQKEKLVHEKTEASAKEFIGKTFWYVPKPTANYRIVFFSSLPNRHTFVQESFYNEVQGKRGVGQFKPLEKTTFKVTNVYPYVDPYSRRDDVYTYEIQFPDGKLGYIQGRIGYGGTPFDGFEGHLYGGYLDPKGEYIFTEDSDVVLARELQKEELAKSEEENALKKEIEVHKAMEAAQIVHDKKEKIAASKAKAKWKAKGGVSIGMTKSQVLASNWGKPNEVNRTITAGENSEQWVFDGGYLYFTNGKLTAIQN